MMPGLKTHFWSYFISVIQDETSTMNHEQHVELFSKSGILDPCIHSTLATEVSVGIPFDLLVLQFSQLSNEIHIVNLAYIIGLL